MCSDNYSDYFFWIIGNIILHTVDSLQVDIKTYSLGQISRLLSTLYSYFSHLYFFLFKNIILQGSLHILFQHASSSIDENGGHIFPRQAKEFVAWYKSAFSKFLIDNSLASHNSNFTFSVHFVTYMFTNLIIEYVLPSTVIKKQFLESKLDYSLIGCIKIIFQV